MPGIDWLESQTTNGLNCSHSACFLRNSADYNPLLHAAAPPDLLFQLCKWQKSEIIVLLSPETRSSPQRPTHSTGVRDVHPGDEVHSFLHFFIHFFKLTSTANPSLDFLCCSRGAPPTAPPINTGLLLCYANSADPRYSKI